MILNYLLLQAQAAEDAGFFGGAGGSIIMIVALFVIMYFFMIRPQQKQQKELRNFIDNLKVGDKVVTSGGIHGKVRRVDTTTFDINIGGDVVITVDRGAVRPAAQPASK